MESSNDTPNEPGTEPPNELSAKGTGSGSEPLAAEPPAAEPPAAEPPAAEPLAPSVRIRALSAEAQRRGAPFVSAEAMQSRLFDIYDDVGVVSEASELVQHQLRLTLSRTWYSQDEIDTLADQIDRFLAGAAEGSSSPV